MACTYIRAPARAVYLPVMCCIQSSWQAQGCRESGCIHSSGCLSRHAPAHIITAQNNSSRSTPSCLLPLLCEFLESRVFWWFHNFTWIEGLNAPLWLRKLSRGPKTNLSSIFRLTWNCSLTEPLWTLFFFSLPLNAENHLSFDDDNIM